MVIDWPADLRPSSASFYLEANTARNESPLSRAIQVLQRQGARWRSEMTFEQRDSITSGRLDGLLAALDGSANEVTLFDFRVPAPRGTVRPTYWFFTDGTGFTDGTDFVDLPYVSAAAAKGADSFTANGFPALEAVLRAGDYVGLNGYLYLAWQGALTDASGTTTIAIRPRLRAPVSAGVPLVFIQPRARFRLADNSQGGNRTSPGLISSYTLSFLESLP